MSEILIVDDEPAICWSLREVLSDEGHSVHTAGSIQQALALLDECTPDAVIVDVRLPDADGISSMVQLHARLDAQTPVIVITAFGDLETAVRAVQAGAFDYLTKPFHLDEAAAAVQRALASRASEPCTDSDHDSLAPGGLLGASPAMQQVFKRIALVAASDAPVLITGESGTGKEEVALAIHRHSSRALLPFVPVCVGALSETVIESELFGHAKGAFTGAESHRKGLLELAYGGTLFLDEVGDIPLGPQVKLLRAIERREVTPVGDPLPRACDFRVVAATHRSLPALVQSGRFREDLLYRLRVFEIVLPPLRQRREDIPVLAEHFLRQLTAEQVPAAISPEAMDELQARPWLGNVRELRHAVEHAAILARSGHIRPEHLPPPVPTTGDAGETWESRIAAAVAGWAGAQLDDARGARESADLHGELMRLVEAPLFKAALGHTRGNRATAAKLLGLHRSTLRHKLREPPGAADE